MNHLRVSLFVVIVPVGFLRLAPQCDEILGVWIGRLGYVGFVCTRYDCGSFLGSV